MDSANANGIIEVASIRWMVEPIGIEAQIEVECILMRLFGPALGTTVGALLEGMAPALVDVLRETAGDGESFDLAHLATLDTSDPRIAGAWLSLLDAIGETAGSIAAGGSIAFAERIDHRVMMRLFDLVVIGKVHAINNAGVPSTVSNFKTLGMLLQHEPRSKWALLSNCLRVTYQGEGREEPPEETPEG